MMVLRQFRDRLATPRKPLGPPPLAALGSTTAKAAAPTTDFQRALGRDQLTGLPNRPCFSYKLAGQAALATQFETELSVLVLDWAGYAGAGADPEARGKRFAALAAQLRGALQRKHDVLGSLGDGRLAALLAFTDASGADRVARNLQRAARDILQADPSPLTPPPPMDNDPPAKLFGRFSGTLDEDLALDDRAEPGETDAGDNIGILNVGLATYCGKGKLDHSALLRAAEQAASFASLNGGDHITRFDQNGRADA
jgi:GGDEF domain-containing protein